MGVWGMEEVLLGLMDCMGLKDKTDLETDLFLQIQFSFMIPTLANNLVITISQGIGDICWLGKARVNHIKNKA